MLYHAYIPPAPYAKQRHPVSNPRETDSRTFLRGCQYCRKRESSSALLRQCAGCKIARYCVRVSGPSFLGTANDSLYLLRQQSKTCQKAAWPLHKIECAQIAHHQERSEARKAFLENLPVDHPECIRSQRERELYLFTKKHMYIIVEWGIRGIVNFYRPPYTMDPAAAAKTREDLLVIYLRTRPNAESARPETRFWVGDIQFETTAFVPSYIREEKRFCLRIGLEQMEDSTRGPCAVFLVVMFVLDYGLTVEWDFPVGFRLNEDTLAVSRSDEQWKDIIIGFLNEGIVL